MPRHAARPIPPDLRSRLEQARLDTRALLRALDQAHVSEQQLPQPATNELYELDADCAEALWALDQPPGALDLKAMVEDTLASLRDLPQARQDVRSSLPSATAAAVVRREKLIRITLGPQEAYTDVPGRDPTFR